MTRTCSTEGCNTVHYGLGLCRLHWRRQRAGISHTPCEVCGKPTPKAGARFCGKPCQMKWHRRHGCYTNDHTLAARGACSIEGCSRPLHSGGLCNVHQRKRWKYGDPLVDRSRSFGSLTCTQCGAGREPESARNLCNRCYGNAYYHANLETERARKNARRSYFDKITPAWADHTAIRRFYAACPAGHQVDHVIPIRNKKVCGLHVLENLQYLSPDANKRKLNRFEIA